jgi:hypothetical protein
MSMFDQLGTAPQGDNMMQTIQRLQQFRNGFHGNAQEQVQQLLRSGKVSQAQYNQAVRMANAIQNFMR